MVFRAGRVQFAFRASQVNVLTLFSPMHFELLKGANGPAKWHWAAELQVWALFHVLLVVGVLEVAIATGADEQEFIQHVHDKPIWSRPRGKVSPAVGTAFLLLGPVFNAHSTIQLVALRTLPHFRSNHSQAN